MEEEIYNSIVALLNERQVTFQTLRHAPVFTSQEAAQTRGTSLSSGAKALICKSDSDFQMFVIPADRKLASKKARRANHWRRLRFATGEEVLRLTGLTPGSIPPFGSLFQLPTYCDEKLAENQFINFNAGHHEISISLTYDDYVAVEQPSMGDFSE